MITPFNILVGGIVAFLAFSKDVANELPGGDLINQEVKPKKKIRGKKKKNENVK